MDLTNLIQWPAMGVTVIAAWLIASSNEKKREVGFWLFLVSNVLWIWWAFYASAFALIVLQLCLAVMNIRGAAKIESDKK